MCLQYREELKKYSLSLEKIKIKIKKNKIEHLLWIPFPSLVVAMFYLGTQKAQDIETEKVRGRSNIFHSNITQRGNAMDKEFWFNLCPWSPPKNLHTKGICFNLGLPRRTPYSKIVYSSNLGMGFQDTLGEWGKVK